MSRYKKSSDRSRKRKCGAPTFVHTIPLSATLKKVTKIETRYEVARLHSTTTLP